MAALLNRPARAHLLKRKLRCSNDSRLALALQAVQLTENNYKSSFGCFLFLAAMDR